MYTNISHHFCPWIYILYYEYDMKLKPVYFSTIQMETFRETKWPILFLYIKYKATY